MGGGEIGEQEEPMVERGKGLDNVAGKKDQNRVFYLRDQVIRIVHLVGVPVLHGIIPRLGAALFSCMIPSARLSTLLVGDEIRAYSGNREKHAVWICPSLTTIGFLPLNPLVSLSSWPLENRIIGTRTLRANHLKTVLALVRLLESTDPLGGSDRINTLTGLLRLYSESVPGVKNCGAELELDIIRGATEDELSLIEKEDEKERVAAARKLAEFPQINQLWGGTPVADNLPGTRR
jgi:hypothetical protein